MSTKTTKTTTEASAEDRQRVQGIRDNEGGGRGLMIGPVDFQQKRSVDFTCYQAANSNTVSSLSFRCLVLMFFSSDSFPPRSLQEILSVLQSCVNIFVPSVP